MKQLKTEIEIHASVEKVWSELTNFDQYPLWNSFIRSTEGEVVESNRVKVVLQSPDSKPMTFHPTCSILAKNKEFRWLGHLFFPGLFDGEHIFELTDLKNEKLNSFIVRISKEYLYHYYEKVWKVKQKQALN